MIIYSLGKFFGWLIVLATIMALGTVIAKFINKRYLKKISEIFKDKQKIIELYKKTITFIIKKHKVFGLIATFIVLVHFIIMWRFVELSLSGLIAMILLLFTASIGAYMNYNKKANKSALIKIHKYSGILLIIAIIFHLI